MATLVELNVPLTVPAGGRFTYTFTAPVDDTGNVLDVTGWVGRGQIKKNSLSSIVYYTWPADQILCAGSAVTVHIPVAASALFEWRRAAYQIEVVAPFDAEGVYRVARGVVTVVPWRIPPPAYAPGGYGVGGYGTSPYGGSGSSGFGASSYGTSGYGV